MINFPFKNSILSSLIKQRISNLNKMRENPIKSQKKIFNYLIDKGKNTMFGIDHSFNKIQKYEDFIQLVPSRKYEEIFSYIEKIRNGEENILWPEKTKLFAKSSGTTNARSKYIPLSYDTLHNCHFKGGKDMLAVYLQNTPESKIFEGKGIILGGSKEINSNFIDGDLSAILLENFPFWVNTHRLPDIKTATMKNWDEKIKKITEQSINENITSLSGVPSWMLLLLKNIIATAGVKNINEIWPDLELYIHGGINFTPYINQFNLLIPSSKMNYLETYNASEGFFALQDRTNSKEMLLMLDYGIFYEFISKEDLDNKVNNYLSLEDVKTDIDYAMIISTNSGLWRYHIGDIVRFTSTNPYRIIIKGRTKNCINTFGEELMVYNTDVAIFEACKRTNSKITDYTVAPIYMSDNSGRHEWAIEFEKQPEELQNFIEIVDEKLKSINSDYEAKRFKNLILDKPKITNIKTGIFYNWLKQKNKLGGQNKIERLKERRDFIDELKNLNS